MMIELETDIFVNSDQINLVLGINNPNADSFTVHTDDDYYEVTDGNREVFLHLLRNVLPDFHPIGNDYVNIKKIHYMKTDDWLELSFPRESFTYDQEELPLKKKQKFLSLFNYESIALEETSIDNNEEIDSDEEDSDSDDEIEFSETENENPIIRKIKKIFL